MFEDVHGIPVTLVTGFGSMSEMFMWNLLRRRSRELFFAWGWLLPVFLPFLYMAGRAAGNLFFVVYILWSALSLRRRDLSFPPWLVRFYLLMLLAYSLGIPGAQEPVAAIYGWVKYALHTSAFFITLIVARSDPDGIRKLVNVAGMTGLATILLLAMQLGYHASQPDFVPAAQVRGLAPAYLLPFMIVWIQERMTEKSRILTGLLLVFSVFTLLVLADSRTELLCASMGLLVFVWLRSARRTPIILLAALLVPLIVMMRMEVTDPVLVGGDSAGLLDRMSSFRIQIWTQAITEPPLHPLVGVGIDNVRYYDPVIINESRSVKHLHNFLLDAWYETGWLGLASLLSLLAYLFTQVLSRLREANRTQFQLAVPLISAVMAIMTAAFLDPSYRSKEFSMFMFVYLAALWRLAEYRQLREQNGCSE